MQFYALFICLKPRLHRRSVHYALRWLYLHLCNQQLRSYQQNHFIPVSFLVTPCVEALHTCSHTDAAEWSVRQLE